MSLRAFPWLFVLALPGCGPDGGTYCQSGPKYGTQCYAAPDVRQPPGAPRPIDEVGRPGEPPGTPPNKRKW